MLKREFFNMIIKEEGIQLSMLILVLLLCKVEMIFDLIFSTITPFISCLYLFSYNRENVLEEPNIHKESDVSSCFCYYQ